MSRFTKLFSLVTVLIIGLISIAGADFVYGHGAPQQPATSYTAVVDTINGTAHSANSWQVSTVTYKDGYVQTLDTGYVWYLDFTTDGSNLVILRGNGTTSQTANCPTWIIDVN